MKLLEQIYWEDCLNMNSYREGNQSQMGAKSYTVTEAIRWKLYPLSDDLDIDWKTHIDDIVWNTWLLFNEIYGLVLHISL